MSQVFICQTWQLHPEVRQVGPLPSSRIQALLQEELTWQAEHHSQALGELTLSSPFPWPLCSRLPATSSLLDAPSCPPPSAAFSLWYSALSAWCYLPLLSFARLIPIDPSVFQIQLLLPRKPSGHLWPGWLCPLPWSTGPPSERLSWTQPPCT